MSVNKNLLNEGTVRRFMKLAGNQAVASDFLKETYYNRDEEDEPMEEGGMGMYNRDDMLEEQPEEDLGLEAGMEEELPEEPEGLEMEPEEGLDDEGGEKEGSVEAFAKDSLEAIAQVAEKHGVVIDVEEAPEPEEIEVGEMESDEGDMTGELGPEDAGEDLGMEDEEDPMAALSEVEYLDEDVLMEKVYRRVTKRLAKEKRADDVATVLAEKLAARVAKKLR